MTRIISAEGERAEMQIDDGLNTKQLTLRDVLNFSTSTFLNHKTKTIVRKSLIKKNMGKIFQESDLDSKTNLIPLYNQKRPDENGKLRSHSSECEYALDECKCWCKGKYHGVGYNNIR